MAVRLQNPALIMVLEESSASDGAEFGADASPVSDDDTYSSPSSSPSSLSKAVSGDFTLDDFPFPRSMPIFGPIAGINRSSMADVARRQIELNSQFVHRPLNKDEATALTYHTSRALAISSYGVPLGTSAGILYVYATRNRFDPAKSWARAIPFISRQSPTAWFMTRAIIMGSLGGYIGKVLVMSYAAVGAGIHQFKDPRLQELNRAKVAQAGHHVQSARQQRSAAAHQQPNKDTDVDSDTSPVTAEDFESEGARLAQGSSETTSTWGPRSPNLPPQQSSGSSPTDDGSSTNQRDQTGPPLLDFEDNSDVAPPTRASSSPTETPAESGSAWERLRRGANTTSESTPRGSSWPIGSQSQGSSTPGRAWSRARADGLKQEQNQASTSGDGFAFSTAEEDKQFAKMEAQKAFDERVERERRGGDFSTEGVGSRGKRW